MAKARIKITYGPPPIVRKPVPEPSAPPPNHMASHVAKGRKPPPPPPKQTPDPLLAMTPDMPCGLRKSVETLEYEPDQLIHIGPQPGPQTAFLMTPADICIYGGAAGGGKSFGLLLEPLRHFENPKFSGTIFRRNSVQIRNQGGLWDESFHLYAPLGGWPRQAFLEWIMPSGSRMKFAHLENDMTVQSYQGAQIPYIGFDELTHFSEKQFWYMLSRNRSTSGVPGYVRATCNPDADSWVRELIKWYINEETGYPIYERSGVVRWFCRVDDELIWGDSKKQLIQILGEDIGRFAKSFTFIPSSLADNKILLEKDPTYRANLRALAYVDRERLEKGNWNIRAGAGTLFRREWFPIIDAIPSGWNRAIRYWDRAATLPNVQNPNPDWTRGLRLLGYPDGTFVVVDLKSMRNTPGEVEKLVLAVASHDTTYTQIMSQCDPGSAGKSEAERFVTILAGFDVSTETLSANKVTRAKPASAQAEVGNIRILRAPWNEAFFKEVENFPSSHVKDDIVDVLSGAVNKLSREFSILDAC